MKILVSIEKDENIDILYSKLCAFLSAVDDHEVYVDLFHVHKGIKPAKMDEISEMVQEIRINEQKMKVNFIGKCENILEAFLIEKLHKTALVNSVLLEGDFKHLLEQRISFHNYDLLILNPSKKNNFQRILTGRNTHWVIDNLEIPVLVLPSYLEETYGQDYVFTCFIDNLQTYIRLKNSPVMKRFEKNHIEYIHFGNQDLGEEIQTVFSSNVSASIKEHTDTCKSNKIFVLHHKNKGDLLNFMDKSFTKTIINSLHNPLLIF